VQHAAKITAAQNGDKDAIISLLREVEAPLYRTAFYMLGNEQDALDATQEALLKIYQNIHRFEHRARFMTWAQRIATNVCIDHIRKKKETVSTDEHEHLLNRESDDYVDKIVEQKLVAESVQHAIHKLTPSHKQVIILRYIHDYTYQDIAQILNKPVNTVKSHLYRARQHLQKLLDDAKGGAHHEVQ
jgi:RNA polymerase sigma factor (sigma-70 family)